MKLIKKINISGKIECLTGLRIGGTSNQMSIGGNDNPIVRNLLTNQPYIPGSSLKGKMRSLIELVDGTISNKSMGDVHNTPTMDYNHRAAKLFGNAIGNDKNNKQRPSRLIVRDCNLLEEEGNFNWNNTDLPYTELKTEVVIDRITSAAMPRNLERVPAGAFFSFEMVLNVFDEDNESELIETLLQALLLLQDDYLGGAGSRGSGQIKIIIEAVNEKNVEFYLGKGIEVNLLESWKKDKILMLK